MTLFGLYGPVSERMRPSQEGISSAKRPLLTFTKYKYTTLKSRSITHTMSEHDHSFDPADGSGGCLTTPEGWYDEATAQFIRDFTQVFCSVTGQQVDEDTASRVFYQERADKGS